MGASNRTLALERKISLLLGEKRDKAAQVEKTEQLIAELPELRKRIHRIDDLIFYCKEIIKDDQPDWKPQRVKAIKPFAHKGLIQIGTTTKKALDVLRMSAEPMTIREIAIEVLRREGHEDVPRDEIDRVCDNMGNHFRKRDRPYLKNDGGWPAKWWIEISQAE